MSAMVVRVRLFAVQREQVGRREVELELAEGATVESAWQALAQRYPVVTSGRAYVRFARNGEYVEADAPLAPGDELAVIPPVSGGDDVGDALPPQDPSGAILYLTEEPFPDDLATLLARRLATPEDGAIVTFVGQTRLSPGTPAAGQEAEALRHKDRRVDALEYEAHETMALKMMRALAAEIAERYGVRRLAIVHRTGTVPLGVPSVLVVAAAGHRDAAFDAARYAIDESKARLPIWKAERFADGHVWIGEPPRSGPR